MNQYEYDPNTDTWTQKASMPGPARAIGAARVCNGKIYVIGNGVNYEFNPGADTWAVKTPAPSTQGGRGVVAGSDQRIYLINDRSYNTSSDPIIHYYRFTNDTWYQAPSNIKGYINLAAVHLDKKLHITGGSVRFVSRQRGAIQHPVHVLVLGLHGDLHGQRDPGAVGHDPGRRYPARRRRGPRA